MYFSSPLCALCVSVVQSSATLQIRMSTDPSSNILPRRASWRWLLAALWLGAIGFIIFCADARKFRPFFNFVSSHPGLDKLGHFLLFGGAAFLLNLALGWRTWRVTGRNWLLGSTLVAVFCVTEEFSQLWFPSRTFDLLDLTADFAGIILFGWLARRFRREGKVVSNQSEPSDQ